MGLPLSDGLRTLLLRDIQLIKNLEGRLPRFPSFPQDRFYPFPFPISFMRLAISMADMAASKPLLPTLVPALSMACSMVSVINTPKEMGISPSRDRRGLHLVTSVAIYSK